MSLFSELGQLAILEPIAGLVAQGKMLIEVDEEKNPYVKQVAAFDPESPWIHSAQWSGRRCNLWLGIYFAYYGLVPKACHACWKCVTRPKNLKEAFAIKKLQEDMGLHSKVGLEKRPYSPGQWHAFWYAPLDEGLEGGRALHRKVKVKVREVLGVQQKVILKHACTEMEIKKGPSDRWVYSERDEQQEALLDNFFRIEDSHIGRHPIIQAHVLRKWVLEAWSRNDPTAWEYASPGDFLAGPVTYHDSEHRDEGFPHGKLEKAEGEEDGSGETKLLRLSAD